MANGLYARTLFCIIMKYRDFPIFKTWLSAILDNLKLKFLTTTHLRDTFCITTPNSVEIGHTIAEIS